MIQWLIDNWISVLIMFIMAVCFILIIISLFRDSSETPCRKSSCEYCALYMDCKKREKKKKKKDKK